MLRWSGTYYQATVLARLADWKYALNSKLWVQLEYFLSGVDLSVAPWIPRSHRNLDRNTSALTISSLDVWDAIHKKFSWNYDSPLLPLLNHTYFLPGLLDPGFKTWGPEEPFLLHHILDGNKLKPLHRILAPNPVTFLDKWRYHQLQHFLRTLPTPLRGVSDLNDIGGNISSQRPPLT